MSQWARHLRAEAPGTAGSPTAPRRRYSPQDVGVILLRKAPERTSAEAQLLEQLREESEAFGQGREGDPFSPRFWSVGCP